MVNVSALDAPYGQPAQATVNVSVAMMPELPAGIAAMENAPMVTVLAPDGLHEKNIQPGFNAPALQLT